MHECPPSNLLNVLRPVAVTPVQNDDYRTFFQSPFPTLPTPQTALLLYSLSHKYPKPLAFGEVELRLILLSPCSVALQIGLLSTANLGVSACCVLGKMYLVGYHNSVTSFVL